MVCVHLTGAWRFLVTAIYTALQLKLLRYCLHARLHEKGHHCIRADNNRL
jgi:hypothetical protein